MTSILHIIPALNIGGVEVGVHRSIAKLQERYSYEVFSIKGSGILDIPTKNRLQVLSQWLVKEKRPDVVVTSLWPSHPLGYAFRQRGAFWMPFFHAANFEGWHRERLLRWAGNNSDAQLSDSKATANYRQLSGENTFICPYIFKTDRVVAPVSQRQYRYSFIGRIAQEKRPDLILEFISAAQARDPNISTLLVLAGQSENTEKFVQQVKDRGVNVTIKRDVSPVDIASLFEQSTFYLSLSDYEGFSMTTVEAIQAGCVPVVRPVGEIPRYVEATDGVFVNDITYDGFYEVAAICSELANSPSECETRIARLRQKLTAYDDYVSAFSRAIDYAVKQR